MVALVNFGTDRPDYTAAAQQMMLQTCLYNQRRELVDDYLGPHARIVIWEQNRDSLPPSWCLIRQGEDDWFLAVEGTTNAWQWVYHVAGTFFRDDFIADVAANGQWVQMLDHIWSAIERELGGIPMGTWHCSGHSFGAGLAQMFGYRLLDERPSAVVEIYGMAAPRAMSAGYSGPSPRCYWRITSSLDLVTLSPDPLFTFFECRWRNPLTWIGSARLWWHYGEEYILTEDGSPGDFLAPQTQEPGPFVEQYFPNVHLPVNYVGRLMAWERRYGPYPVMARALEVAEAALTGGTPVREMLQMSQYITGPDGQLVLIPSAYSSIYGGGKVAFYKCTYLFRSGSGSTWTESHTLQSSAGVDAASDIAVGAALLNSRLALLHSVYRLQSVSVMDTAGNRVARKRNIGLPGTWSPTGKNADIAGVTVSLKCFGQTGRIKYSWIRGVGDEIVDLNSATGEVQFDTAWLTALGTFVTRLRGAGFGWVPRLRVNPAVPATQYNPIQSVDGSAFPGFAVITTTNPCLASAGDALTISRSNRKLLPGLDGNWKVIAATGNVFRIQYQVAGNAIVANPGGRMRLYQPDDFELYFSLLAVGAIGRRTKNAFSPSRAAQSARGVRTAR